MYCSWETTRDGQAKQPNASIPTFGRWPTRRARRSHPKSSKRANHSCQVRGFFTPKHRSGTHPPAAANNRETVLPMPFALRTKTTSLHAHLCFDLIVPSFLQGNDALVSGIGHGRLIMMIFGKNDLVFRCECNVRHQEMRKECRCLSNTAAQSDLHYRGCDPSASPAAVPVIHEKNYPVAHLRFFQSSLGLIAWLALFVWKSRPTKTAGYCSLLVG